MSATASRRPLLPDAHRAALAEYAVLGIYRLERQGRYGDMGAARQKREISRRADALLAAGVQIDREGGYDLPVRLLTEQELRAAFERVGRPRLNRVLAATHRTDTKYSRATVIAWESVARELGAAL